MSLSKSTTWIILISVLSVLVLVTAQRPQMIRFFTQTDCRPATGTGAPFQEYTSSLNISAQTFQSYCVVRGAWRVEFSWVQSESDYNISVGDSCASCINRGSSSKRYGYIQRIGGIDLTQASFYLYREANFIGMEAAVNGWEISFNETYSFSSVAFTSFGNWTWQAYYSPRFRGTSMCFRPDVKSEITLINHQTLNVGSVRLGCRNSGNSLQNRGVAIIIIVIIAVAIPSASVLL